jgi:hypothetical protein
MMSTSNTLGGRRRKSRNSCVIVALQTVIPAEAGMTV